MTVLELAGEIKKNRGKTEERYMVKLILCLKRKGRILEGYDADLCILDQDLQLTDVIVRGKRVH